MKERDLSKNLSKNLSKKQSKKQDKENLTKNFSDVIKRRITAARFCLSSKGEEYANELDRYHNFNYAASLVASSPAVTLLGMQLKHTVSVIDMVREIKMPNERLIREKCGDLFNYFILLYGMTANNGSTSTSTSTSTRTRSMESLLEDVSILYQNEKSIKNLVKTYKNISMLDILTMFTSRYRRLYINCCNDNPIDLNLLGELIGICIIFELYLWEKIDGFSS